MFNLIFNLKNKNMFPFSPEKIYTSKSKRGECKNEGCKNKISQKVHSAYCDKCLEEHKKNSNK